MNGTIEETPPPEGLPPSPAPAAEAGRPLAGRVALVTGASRGIGRALALGLAHERLAVGLLARSRAREAALDSPLEQALLVTVAGIAAGLRNTG